jgi:hypothetical protein
MKGEIFIDDIQYKRCRSTKHTVDVFQTFTASGDSTIQFRCDSCDRGLFSVAIYNVMKYEFELRDITPYAVRFVAPECILADLLPPWSDARSRLDYSGR